MSRPFLAWIIAKENGTFFFANCVRCMLAMAGLSECLLHLSGELLRFLGQQEKFGQSKCLKKFACMCACCVVVVFFGEIFSILNLIQRGKAI